jgi:hypothetical protein
VLSTTIDERTNTIFNLHGSLPPGEEQRLVERAYAEQALSAGRTGSLMRLIIAALPPRNE